MRKNWQRCGKLGRADFHSSQLETGCADSPKSTRSAGQSTANRFPWDILFSLAKGEHFCWETGVTSSNRSGISSIPLPLPLTDTDPSGKLIFAFIKNHFLDTAMQAVYGPGTKIPLPYTLPWYLLFAVPNPTSTLMTAWVTVGQMVREQEQRMIQSHRNLWENLCSLQCTLGTPKGGVQVKTRCN